MASQKNAHLFTEVSPSPLSSPPYTEVREPPVDSSPLAHDDLADFHSSLFDEVESLSSPASMPRTESHVLVAPRLRLPAGRPSLPGIATIEDEQRKSPFVWPSPAPLSGLAALGSYASDSDTSPERSQPRYAPITRPPSTVQMGTATNGQQVGGGRDATPPNGQQVGGGREATPPKQLQPTRLRSQITHIESPGERGERRSRTSFIDHLKAGEVDFEEISLPPPPPNFHTETPPGSPSVHTRTRVKATRQRGGGRGHAAAVTPSASHQVVTARPAAAGATIQTFSTSQLPSEKGQCRPYTSFSDYLETGDFKEVPLPPPPFGFHADTPSATAPLQVPLPPPPSDFHANTPSATAPPLVPTDAPAVSDAAPLYEDDTVHNGDMFDGNNIDDENDTSTYKGKRGRPSITQVRAVERLIQEVTEMIDTTVSDTGLGRELIIRKLLHEIAGPTFNRSNIWHRFLKYAYHQDRRLDVVRLADPDFEAPQGEWLPTKGQVSASWSVFTALHTREQQEETLSAFEEGIMLLAEETVRDRQRAFEKGYDALTTGMRAQLRNSEFDSFFIFTGPHINDDVQLAQSYTTPRAENFLHNVVDVEPRDFIGLFRLYTYCEELRPILAAVRTNTGTALDLTQVFKSHTANIWETSHIQALAKAGKNLRTPVATGIAQSGSTSVQRTFGQRTSVQSTPVQRTNPATDPVVVVNARALRSDKSAMSRRDAELAHNRALEAHSAALDTAAANGSTLPPQLIAWLDVPTTCRAPLKFDYSGLTAEQKSKAKAENHSTNRQTYDGEDRYYNNNIREALTEISRIDLRGKDVFHSIRSDNMTWTTLHQTLLDQKVRMIGFPSHMTIPTLAGSEKATNSWTMIDRAALALALRTRVLGSLAGLRLEYHAYDGADDFAIVCHSYLRAPPAHDAGDEAFWRSSGGEALLAVTGAGLIYSSIYDLRISGSPTSTANVVYDNRPKTKQKLPLAVASSSKHQPDDDDDDDNEELSSVEEIGEQVAEGKEEEAVVQVTKEKKGKARAAGSGKQKSKATDPNARRKTKAPTTKATSRQQKAKRMANDEMDLDDAGSEVEPEPLPARTTRSRSRPPATSVSMPAASAAPVQTGGGSTGGHSQSGDVPPRPLPRPRNPKPAAAALPGEASARNGMGRNCVPEDGTPEVSRKTVRFVTDVVPVKRGPEENVFQPPPNKRQRPSDESLATPIVPVAVAVPDTTAHSAIIASASTMGLNGLNPSADALSGVSGTTLPPPSSALPPPSSACPAASSTVNGVLPPGTSGISPASSNPALPFPVATVPAPTTSGVDPTMWAMTAMMATLSEAQRTLFLQQMGSGTR